LEALHKRNIQSRFAATGLVLFDPDQVLSLVYAQFKTPSPQLLPQTSPQAWISKTHQDIVQLKKQTELLKQHLERRSKSPITSTNLALDQLVKGCEMAMYSIVLLASENERLLAENRRQKKKQATKRSYIQKGGILTGADAISLINKEQDLMEVIEARSNRERQRAPPWCSLCGLLDHKAPRCSETQVY
jgi:hypothetical protein